MKHFLTILTLVLFASTTLCFADTNEDSNAVYKLYPTKNMWTFLKLNTRNGQLWQVQFDVSGSNRGEVDLSPITLCFSFEEKNGRFELYPTQNMYNFIMLDRVDGRTWQVQWSQDEENRGIIKITQ